MSRARPEVSPGQLSLELPPGFTVRESRRARTVRLHMIPKQGLVIVIPAGYSRRKIPAILAEKQDWIEKAQRWADDYRHRNPAIPLTKPETIELKAVGETWSVSYAPDGGRRITVREHEGSSLRVTGGDGGARPTARALTRWTARRARSRLVPWLKDTSDELGMPFRDAAIRNQKSRWGSCSPAKSISLNQKLLLLPEELVRYVFIHELCHTVHLNHSKRFWALVKTHEPEFAELRKELGDAWKYVPRWLEV